MSNGIQSDDRFTKADGLEVNEVPDGCVIYQLKADRVHFLNPTAVIIFELCEGQLKVSEIEAFVVAAFELKASPTEEIHNCFGSLVAEGLIVRCAL
jgi:hypothetical protein